jgi:glycosyltransferase involved in cell wall biosynthesis
MYFMLIYKPRKVLGIPIDGSATSYHRVVQPLHHLMQEGLDIQFLGEQNKQAEQYDWADILYIQCLYAPDAYNFYFEQKKAGKHIIIDFDDDYINIPEDSPEQTEIVDKNGEVHKFPTKLRALYIKMFVGLADVVVVTTDTLKKLYGPSAKKIVVIPNCMSQDMKRDKPKLPNDKVRILWSGSASHKPDLLEANEKGYLQAVHEKYKDKVEFHFQGPLNFSEIFPNLPLISHPAASFGDYLNIIQDINPDIAIAPLKSNVFNQSKSNLKYLQMTLMEAAFVGQNMNPYVGIENGHDGFLADGTNSWIKALSKLVESPELRKKIVANATKYVESHFMIEKQISKWKDLVSF